MLALVTAASGIGDIVRVTPLVRALHELGYEVDVLLAPDYLASCALLDGSPEIRRLYYVPSSWCTERGERTDGLARETYDVATYTTLSVPLRARVRARRTVAFDPAQWRRDGDTACIARLAEHLGWSGPLPHPFVRHSARDFALPVGTVALHPGCKPRWGWKRWHGFPELAALLPDVAIVGTATDFADDPTSYFRGAGGWPAHAHNFVGTLSLADTTALLSQCVAVVANDSGLMHVAAALGVPTFGIFGLTSQEREAMPLPNMHAISKGLPCEGDCRRRPWGRTDCEHHLRCLRTLDAEEVLVYLQPVLAAAACTADE
jgi:ADP-heptose:LPS heptosyltransferase